MTSSLPGGIDSASMADIGADNSAGSGANNGADSSTKKPDLWRVALLAAALALFGQTFHYMKDLKPLWALSKAFPLLALPLCLPVLLLRRRLPLLLLWCGIFIYLILMPSFIAMSTFDQNFFLGLTAQVKLLPILYVFSFLGLLLIVRPSLDELQKAFLWCGAGIFITLVLLWLFAPLDWYTTEYEFGDAPLLSADDRGKRIRMPMYFGLIMIFFLYRRFMTQPRLLTALSLLLAMLILVGIVKTRATVLATGVTLILLPFAAARPAMRIAVVLIACVAAFGVLQIPYVASAFDTSAASGFNIRQITIEKAAAFLGDSPLRWIFGVGTITPLQPDGLPRYFNHFFFLADISWLGIVFEYGLIGAAFLLTLLTTTWLFGRYVALHANTPFVGALRDYVLFTIIISPLYATMTLQPGEIAVIAATFIYCWLLTGQQQAQTGGETAAGAG